MAGMGHVGVTVVDTPALNAMLHGPNGAVAREMLVRGLRVEAGAKRRVKTDKGRLRQSITHEVLIINGLPACRVGTNVSYAMAVHNGSGIYGPSGQPIKPKVSSVLKFTYNGQTIYVKSARGQEANPFLKDALDEII